MTDVLIQTHSAANKEKFKDFIAQRYGGWEAARILTRKKASESPATFGTYTVILTTPMDNYTILSEVPEALEGTGDGYVVVWEQDGFYVFVTNKDEQGRYRSGTIGASQMAAAEQIGSSTDVIEALQDAIDWMKLHPNPWEGDYSNDD